MTLQKNRPPNHPLDIFTVIILIQQNQWTWTGGQGAENGLSASKFVEESRNGSHHAHQNAKTGRQEQRSYRVKIITKEKNNY